MIWVETEVRKCQDHVRQSYGNFRDPLNNATEMNTTVNIEQKWMKRKCTMRMLKDGMVDGVIREMLKARGSLLMYWLSFAQAASLFGRLHLYLTIGRIILLRSIKKKVAGVNAKIKGEFVKDGWEDLTALIERHYDHEQKLTSGLLTLPWAIKEIHTTVLIFSS